MMRRNAVSALRTTVDSVGGTRYRFRAYQTIIRNSLVRERHAGRKSAGGAGRPVEPTSA
jgi:hypothetical protein